MEPSFGEIVQNFSIVLNVLEQRFSAFVVFQFQGEKSPATLMGVHDETAD